MGWATRQNVAFKAETRQLGGVSVTAGAVSGMGLLDMPGELVMDDRVINTNYRLTCRADQFGTLSYGDQLQADGQTYLVQELQLIADGNFCMLTLEKVIAATNRLVTLAGDALVTLDGRYLVKL